MVEFFNGNRITLLKSGAEYFPQLEAEIDTARHEVHLETYIFKADATGRAVAGALARAARRGVSVHVLVDGYGSQGLDPALVKEMEAAGVQLLVYRPNISPWSLHHARLRRLHRKVAVIDARIAFVGGINVLDDIDRPGDTALRFDYAVRVEGPMLGKIHPVVRWLWKLVATTQLRARLSGAVRLVPSLEHRGRQRAAFVTRDNLGHRREIEKAYLEAIGEARSEILIANAYFFPGQSFRWALRDAAARGVRVILLLQGRVEYVLQHYASRALYGAFLDAGIEIHEYFRGFLHAKVAVIDRRWATVGSSNIDPYSLVLAREANVVIDDESFAAQLRESLLAEMNGGASQVKRESWKGQPLPVRVFTWGCYGLLRLLAGVFAYGRGREYT
jgi:cardiolipin synthase